MRCTVVMALWRRNAFPCFVCWHSIRIGRPGHLVHFLCSASVGFGVPWWSCINLSNVDTMNAIPYWIWETLHFASAFNTPENQLKSVANLVRNQTCRFSVTVFFLLPCSHSVLRGSPGHIRHFFGARFLVMGVDGIEKQRGYTRRVFKCISQLDSREYHVRGMAELYHDS